MMKRDIKFDLLKSIAIFLVILQHCIFIFGYGMDMMNTVVGKAICLVNMPLFMFIVGFFAKSSVYAKNRDFVNKKWNTIVVPMLIFCFLQTLVAVIFGDVGPAARRGVLEVVM